MSLNLLKTKEISRSYDDHEFQFTIRELGGLENDRIFDECRTLDLPKDLPANLSEQDKDTLKNMVDIKISMAKMYEQKIIRGVKSAKLDGTEFDIKLEVSELPKDIFKWLLSNIEGLSQVSVKEEKKNPTGVTG